MIEHPVYGNIDNGYENDNQEVLIGKHIQVLRGGSSISVDKTVNTTNLFVGYQMGM